MSGRGTLADRAERRCPLARMPLPKDRQFVTFDCLRHPHRLGGGRLRRLPEGGRPRRLHDRPRRADPALPPRSEREIQSGSYELYAEVLRRTAVQIAKELGWPLEPSRSGFLPDSVQRWPPFKETNAAARASSRRSTSIGLLSNIDDKLLGADAAPLPRRLRPRRHRAAGALLQARPGPLQGVRAAHRRQEGWVHVAASYYHDVEPCLKLKVPVIWVNRHEEELEPGQKKPTAEVTNLREAAKLLGPSDDRCVRAVGVHADVVVVTSRDLADDLHGGARRASEAFADRLARLPGRARGAAGAARAGGLRVRGLLATHADWDHLLGPLAFPEAALGVGEPTARAAARPSPGAAQRELRAFDDEHYVARAAAARARRRQALPVPGHCERRRAASSSCTPPTGTRPTARRCSRRWAGVLCCGDYLSAGRDPDALGRAARWTPTARRSSACAPLVERARDGRPRPRRGRSTATPRCGLLDEDLAYLEALERDGERAPLPGRPPHRRQRRIHAANVAARLAESSRPAEEEVAGRRLALARRSRSPCARRGAGRASLDSEVSSSTRRQPRSARGRARPVTSAAPSPRPRAASAT